MAWEDELEQKIISAEDKVLFKESTECLKSGCYRAGYIVAWLSIAESLKSKMIALANLGEKRAETAHKKIEAEEANLKSVDKLIIAEAKDCNLIDQSEFKKLEFLWGERCKFAHPYQTAPNPDELKYIINQSVELTLGKPLLYRKNFIDDFIVSISTQLHYFTNNRHEISRVVRNIFPRVARDLHPYFLKSLLAKLGEIIGEPSMHQFMPRFQVIIMDLLLIHKESLNDEIWGLERISVNYPQTIIRIVNADIWPFLSNRIKEILVQFAISPTWDEHTDHARNVMKWMNDASVFEDNFKKEFYDFLHECRLENVFYYYSFDNDLYEEIRTSLESTTYTDNNAAITVIESPFGVDFLKILSTEQKFDLGRLIMLCAINNSFKAKSYIRYERAEIDKDILSGMLLMCFVDDDSFSFRGDFLNSVFKKIESVNDVELIKYIFSKTMEALNGLKNQRMFTQGAIEMLDTLKQIYGQNTGNAISDLKGLIERMPVQTPLF